MTAYHRTSLYAQLLQFRLSVTNRCLLRTVRKGVAFFRGLEQIALLPILKQTVVLHSFGQPVPLATNLLFSQQYKLIGKNHICPPIVLIVVLIF